MQRGPRLIVRPPALGEYSGQCTSESGFDDARTGRQQIVEPGDEIFGDAEGELVIVEELWVHGHTDQLGLVEEADCSDLL